MLGGALCVTPGSVCDTGRVGVPGGVLLSLASKGECLLWFLERGRVWHGGGSDCPLWPAGHLGWWEPCGGGAAPSAQQPGCVHGSHTVMKGNAIFRAPSLIGVRLPAPGCVNRPRRGHGGWGPTCSPSRVCRAGGACPSVRILQSCVPPSTSWFTGCELQLGEETGLNVGQGLGINWGFMGSFMFLFILSQSPSLPGWSR